MKWTRTSISILLAIMLIVPAFPMAWAMTEFVDGYENENYVSSKYNVIRNSTLDCIELNYTAEGSTLVTSPIQLREHDYHPSYNPAMTFTKYATYIRISSTTTSLGEGLIFFVVDREWLDGKYLRWRWTHGGYSVGRTNLYDGEYDRSSMTDFPSNAPMLIKGNGLLQTLREMSGTETSDVLIDSSGGTQSKATIFIWLQDHWTGQSMYNDLYWLEINEGAGGADNILTWNMVTAGTTLTMEQIGTLNDYGRVDGGDIEDYSEGGYKSDGYFYTTQVLNGINGSTVALLTNVTLNSGTLKVQFSDDNSTWVNHNGTAPFLISYGIDFLIDGTATADSEWSATYAPSKAFNDNTGDRWSSTDSAFPHWIKYDLGSGVNNTANKLRIKAFTSPPLQLKDFKLQGSNDDSEWTELLSETASDSDAWQEWTFSNDVAYRYYRIWITSSYFGGGDQVSIWEIELMNSSFYGYDSLIEGYESLDLRDLNFTTLYMRYNFTSGGPELTPRLYQIRVITIPDEIVDDYENENYISSKVNVIRNSTLDCMELIFDAEGNRTVVYTPIQLREHKCYADWNPWITFEKWPGEVRMGSNNPSLGSMNLFFVVDRVWIDGKYLRWRWSQSGSGSGSTSIFDGEYDRASATDFPSGSAMITKGNGLLQTLDTVDTVKTSDALIDTSGGTEDKVTIFIRGFDAWSASSVGVQFYWLQINEGAGGADNILTWNMITAGTTVTMEVTGTYADRGRVHGGDIADYEASLGSYRENGWFYTTELLSSVNGSSLDLLTNSTLDYGSITVEFSEDNSTWVDHNNQTGYDSLIEGYKSIDLRDLNFTTIYMRYNFTRGGFDRTSRLYQTRLLISGYEGAPPGDGEEPPFVDYFPMLLAIVLCLGLSVYFLYLKNR